MRLTGVNRLVQRFSVQGYPNPAVQGLVRLV
jgi:hypothetical protein